MESWTFDAIGIVVFILGFIVRSSFLKKSNDFMDWAPNLYYKYCIERGYREGQAFYKRNRRRPDPQDLYFPKDLKQWLEN